LARRPICSSFDAYFSVLEISKVKAAKPQLGHKEAFQQDAANWQKLKTQLEDAAPATAPTIVISQGNAAVPPYRPKRALTQSRYNEFIKKR
jgi:hypothetical protein